MKEKKKFIEDKWFVMSAFLFMILITMLIALPSIIKNNVNEDRNRIFFVMSQICEEEYAQCSSVNQQMFMDSIDMNVTLYDCEGTLDRCFNLLETFKTNILYSELGKDEAKSFDRE